MKLSKPLSALILIASALLLSAAGENPETPKPQPKENAYAQSPATQHSPPSSASMSATFQPTSAQAASQRASNTYNYYYPAKDTWDWSGIVQAIATLGLLGFALWQMDFVRRSTKATENAAKAASDNAEAAKDAVVATERYVELTKELTEASRLALKIDRPYLILEHAQLTGVLSGDGPAEKESPQLNELKTPPMFSPRVVLRFRNYGKGPVIFSEGIIRIDALPTLPPPRDFSGCKRMGLQANAVRAGGVWYPLAQFNFDADWSALFPDIAAGRKNLIAYGCVRYTDPIGKDIYETGFCWVFIPPRTEFQKMPKAVAQMLGPYRAPGAPDPEMPIATKMPADFLRGPKTHNYCD